MKKSIVLLASVLLIAVIIPFSVGFTHIKNTKETSAYTNSSAESIAQDSSALLSENEIILNDDEIDYILSKVLEYVDENTNKEVIKAITTICKNNFIYHKQTGSSQDEVDIKYYSDEFLEKLRIIYKETDVDLLYNNNYVYIPIVDNSPGYIVTDNKFPYIISVACPWDTFCEDYVPNYEYSCGISINSIEYLCETGSDYIETLRWHLPKLTIQKNTK